MAGQNVRLATGYVMDLLNSTTGVTSAPTTGDWKFKDAPNTGLQVVVTGSGTVTCTVIIEVSNDGVNACATPAGTITLSGTTTASDGFVIAAAWKYIRARVTAISGTNAAVFCTICG